MHYPTDHCPKILLLWIGLDGQDSRPGERCPGMSDLVQIFCAFGGLKRISVFSRAVFTKAFLEFTFPEEALSAREFVHGSSINDFGCARFVPFTRQQIEFCKEPLDYWDINTPSSLKSLSHQSTGYDRLGEPNPDNLGNQAAVRPMSLQFVQSAELGSPQTCFGVQTISQMFNKSQSILPYQTLSQPWSIPPEGEVTDLVSPKPFVIRPSKVILASNLDNFFDSAIQLFNLFSCFGNLSKVLLMKNLQKAMLQYTSISGSQQCIDYFTEYPLEEMALRVNFSKYSKIDLKKRNKSKIPNSTMMFSSSLLSATASRPANLSTGLSHRRLSFSF
jgi:hypothetical protein